MKRREHGGISSYLYQRLGCHGLLHLHQTEGTMGLLLHQAEDTMDAQLCLGHTSRDTVAMSCKDGQLVFAGLLLGNHRDPFSLDYRQRGLHQPAIISSGRPRPRLGTAWLCYAHQRHLGENVESRCVADPNRKLCRPPIRWSSGTARPRLTK